MIFWVFKSGHKGVILANNNPVGGINWVSNHAHRVSTHCFEEDFFCAACWSKTLFCTCTSGLGSTSQGFSSDALNGSLVHNEHEVSNWVREHSLEVLVPSQGNVKLSVKDVTCNITRVHQRQWLPNVVLEVLNRFHQGPAFSRWVVGQTALDSTTACFFKNTFVERVACKPTKNTWVWKNLNGV